MSRNFLGHEISDLARDIQNVMEAFPVFFTCLQRVPEDLRKLNKIAYTPRLVAIGPFHRDKAEFQRMKYLKLYYISFLIDRLAVRWEDSHFTQKVLIECHIKMEESVRKAHEFYGAEVNVGDEEMLQMMVIDGCFILGVLYASYMKKSKEAKHKATNGGNSKEDGSKGGSYSGQQRVEMKYPHLQDIVTSNIIKQDLVLLENQIPFFVLESLFEVTLDKMYEVAPLITGSLRQLSLTDYIVSYFEDIMFPQGVNKGGSTSDCVLSVSSSADEIEHGEEVSREANQYLHILQLLHSKCLPVPGRQLENKKHGEIKLSDLRISASDLDYAGVKFECKNNNLFDIKFHRGYKGISSWFQGGKFEIPIIRIHGSTEAFLRNLIAFEQSCLLASKPYFTSYAMFMDMLINSEKDVQVLKKANVINNSLGTDKDVFDLFNNLCKEVVTGEFYFSAECQDAFDFSQRNWWPMFIAYLKRTYFGSPWGFIGFCLAFVAFGMSVIQFIYGFLK